MRYLTILGLLFSLSTFAVTPVKQGDPAPGQGYYITPDEEKGFRKLNEENITLKDLQVHQEQKVQILDERVKGYKDYVDQQKQLGPWEKTGYVALGVVGSVLLLFLATSVVKSAGK
jgi:hypothetical protein